MWQRMRELLDGEAASDVLPKEKFAEALGYLRNQWDALQVYLGDGRLPIDNNETEQLMKQVALGRKNWLFLGSVAAGERMADLLTLVSSALRNDLDVWAYVKDVLDQLLAGSTDYASLRPDRWAASHPEHIRTYRADEDAATAPPPSTPAAPAAAPPSGHPANRPIAPWFSGSAALTPTPGAVPHAPTRRPTVATPTTPDTPPGDLLPRHPRPPTMATRRHSEYVGRNRRAGRDLRSPRGGLRSGSDGNGRRSLFWAWNPFVGVGGRVGDVSEARRGDWRAFRAGNSRRLVVRDNTHEGGCRNGLLSNWRLLMRGVGGYWGGRGGRGDGAGSCSGVRLRTGRRPGFAGSLQQGRQVGDVPLHVLSRLHARRRDLHATDGLQAPPCRRIRGRAIRLHPLETPGRRFAG